MTPLLGPGDADHFRVQVGRYGDRWYADPLPSCPIAEATDDSWPSVTTIKKASGSDWSYVAMKRIAEADLLGIDLLAVDELYERFKSINKLGLERAGRRGTNVHKYFERGLSGEPFNDPEFPDEPGSDYLPAVQQFFDTYQPELVAAEVVSINRSLGYGGSPDCFARIDGKVYIIDWKSRGADSKHGAYPEEAAQVAAYANADYLIVEGADGPERILVPEVDGGLIVSVKPDGCRIFPIDLRAAFEHWYAMFSWWQQRQTERDCIGKPWAPRKIAGGASTTATAEAPPASIVRPTGAPSSLTPTVAFDRRQWAVQRVIALSDDGRRHLGEHWPEGVVTLKASLEHTDAELDLIIAAIDDAEKQTEAPFNPEPVEPVPLRTATPQPATDEPDEGPDVGPDEIAAAKVLYDEQHQQLDAWARMVHDDGGRSLNLRQRPTLWRFAVLTALAHAARAGIDDDGLRELAYGATRDQACLMLSVPVGQVIASLTIEQADRLANLARALGTDQLTLAWDDEGTPVFGGPAWGDAA